MGVLCVAASCGSPKPPPAKPAPAAPAVAARPPVRPICAVETTAGLDREPRDRVFPAQNWFVLMVHAYRSDGEMARPLTDCTGRVIKLDVDGCGRDPLPEAKPTQLTPDDLVVTSLGEERRLVWVITEHLPDGQGQGPVAIATVEPRGIAVRALGVLRAYREHVTLRLETVSGAQVLVADGQRCADPDTAASCERAIRVVPLVGDRFVMTPLVTAEGTCISSTLFPVRTKGTQTAAHGATYELEAATNFSQGTMVVREQLAVSRAPRPHAAKDTSSEAFIARLQLERTIAIRNGRLVTDGPSLLTRWMRQSENAPSADQ